MQHKKNALKYADSDIIILLNLTFQIISHWCKAPRHAVKAFKVGREKWKLGGEKQAQLSGKSQLTWWTAKHRRAFNKSQNIKRAISISYIKERAIMSIQVESLWWASACVINWVCHSTLFTSRSEKSRSGVMAVYPLEPVS